MNEATWLIILAVIVVGAFLGMLWACGFFLNFGG
jgi:hypothetical protein